MSSLNQKKTDKSACRLQTARFSGVSLIERGGLPLRGRLTLALLATLVLYHCDLFDIIPPKIEIVSPREDDSYVGTLSCEIDATDNQGITRVEVFLDNVSIHEFTKAPYKADLDIPSQSAGTTTFKAIAYDKAGNWAEAQREVHIVKGTPTTGLVAWYPFNGNANDESGNGNDGTVYGATLAADRFGNAGNAYSFDGVDDYIDVNITDVLKITQEITITAWINFNGGYRNPRVLNFSADASPDGYLLYTLGVRSTRQIHFIFGGVVVSSKNYLDANTWYFITAKGTSTDVSLYINDVLDSTTIGIPSGFIYSTPFNIGRKPFPAYDIWGGKLDDIRIYNRPLSEAEIQALFYEGGWDANP